MSLQLKATVLELGGFL